MQLRIADSTVEILNDCSGSEHCETLMEDGVTIVVPGNRLYAILVESEADGEREQHGGSLANIRSDEENNLVRGMISSSACNKTQLTHISWQ